MPRFLASVSASLLLACALLALHPCRAEAASTPDPLALADDDSLYRCKKYPENARIRVTLKPETTLTDLVAWAMGFSCKSFLYGSGVASHTTKITVMAPADMTPREAYRLFLVSLSSMQLTVVPHGKTLEIVEPTRAKESALPIVAAGALPAEGGMLRVVMRPRHVLSTDLAAVLSTVKSATGVVTDVPAANIVVVTDDHPVLVRMGEIAALVDVQRHNRLLRVPLEHTDADEVAKMLTSALTDKTRVKILPDGRTDALLVVGPDDELAQVAELVRAIDVPSRGSEPRAHVVRLEHASAEETAAVLTSVFGGSASAIGTSPSATAPATAKPTGRPATVAGASTTVASTSGNVKVAFARSTNVLIVTASDADFRSVRDVVRELDVQRPQVYVEAVIMDMSADRSRQIGVSLHGAGTSGSSTLFGSTNQSSTSTSVITDKNATNLLVGGISAALLGPTFKIAGVSIPSLGALFQAVKTTSDVNVLSSPQLIATDNEEATLKVGSNVPTPGALASSSSTTLIPTGTTVERVNVDLTFKVKPHIGANGDVTLELDLDIKELGESDPTLGVTYTTRAMHTMVTVKDQQPIVLGGLMRDSRTTARTQVPFFGDLPLIGGLFRSTTTTHEKRSLMVVLVPYVVMDAVDARRLLERKMRERQEFEAALGNLESAEYDAFVDYRKKRGLVAEIDHQVRASDEEAGEGLQVAPLPAPDTSAN